MPEPIPTRPAEVIIQPHTTGDDRRTAHVTLPCEPWVKPCPTPGTKARASNAALRYLQESLRKTPRQPWRLVKVIARRTNVNTDMTRVQLYRLEAEGKVQKRQRPGGDVEWRAI